MQIWSNKYSCCGCSACATNCPHKAITMKPDDYGFKYPYINEDLCIDCGLCLRSCQFHNQYQTDGFESPIVYGARQKEKKELLLSQSGGLSALILKIFFEEDGVAYGVGFVDGFKVSHIRVTDYKTAQMFRGSKYVQSDLGDVFTLVKHDLKNEKRTLFIGTPCQVSGLKSILPSQYKKSLYTIDIVCHSVSSPAVWIAYVRFLENKYGSKIRKTNLRDKKFGWHKCLETYELENGKTITTRGFDDLFFKHLIVRPSCSNCPYTNLRRVGDITIGDFWGWENNHKEFNDDLGLNLVLINSKKGNQLFQKAIPYLDYRKSSEIECLQPQLKFPISLNSYYDDCLNDFKNKGVKYVMDKYNSKSIISHCRNIASKIKHFLCP